MRDVRHICVHVCECVNYSDCELRKDARAFHKQGHVPQPVPYIIERATVVTLMHTIVYAYVIEDLSCVKIRHLGNTFGLFQSQILLTAVPTRDFEALNFRFKCLFFGVLIMSHAFIWHS